MNQIKCINCGFSCYKYGWVNENPQRKTGSNDKGILVKCFISAKMCTILAIFLFI